MSVSQPFFPVFGSSLEDVKTQISNSILIVPAVSVGNVPQLAVDLLIYSLDMKLVGRLNEEFVYPFSGPRDSPSILLSDSSNSSKHTGISTAIEVFNSKSLGITVVQVRSPTLPNCRRKFVQNTLVPFIKLFNFSETVIAGSSNAALSEVIPAPRYKVFYQESSSDNNAVASQSPFQSLSKRLSELSLSGGEISSSLSKAPTPASKLPESGIVLDALQGIATSSEKACAAVLYVYEGDNFIDAHELADNIVSLVGLNINEIKKKLPTPKTKNQNSASAVGISNSGKWIEPLSWNGVYGKEIPIGLEEGLYS